MLGRAEIVIWRRHGRFVHVAMSLAIRHHNSFDSYAALWMSVLEATGQHPHFAEA